MDSCFQTVELTTSLTSSHCLLQKLRVSTRSHLLPEIVLKSRSNETSAVLYGRRLIILSADALLLDGPCQRSNLHSPGGSSLNSKVKDEIKRTAVILIRKLCIAPHPAGAAIEYLSSPGPPGVSTESCRCLPSLPEASVHHSAK